MTYKRSIIVAGTAALFAAAFIQNARAHDEPVVGSLVGAGIGAAVAGPPGAAVGAVIGAAIGSHEAHKTDHGPSGRHLHASRHRHPVVHSHVRERSYAAEAPYACAERPVRVAYTHAHANGNGTSTPPARRQVKMKRVCKYVAVRPARQVLASR